MTAVGLTDHGSLLGGVDLYRKAGKHEGQADSGCEIYVTDDRRSDEGEGTPHTACDRQHRYGESDQAESDTPAAAAADLNRV
jgi:DNA polymerase III alpha subunit